MSIRFDKKHTDIVEAAIQIFLKSGFGGTSMDGVAQAAGVSKATLYNHFKDKHELFQEVMIWHCQNLATSASLNSHLSNGSVEERLSLFAHGLVKALLEPRSIALMRVVIFEAGQFPELGSAIWKDGKLPLLEEFSILLESEHNSGRLSIANIPIASRQFFGLIKENLVWPKLMGIETTRSTVLVHEVIESSVQMFMYHYRTREG